MSVLVSVIVYGAIAVIGTIAGLVLLFSAYLFYIHRKFSHMPSPKRSNSLKSFFLGHLPDLWEMEKRTGRTDYIQKLYQPWSESAGSSTYVVFMIYAPMVITLDPQCIKKVCSTEEIGKSQVFKYGVEYDGQRSFGESLLTIQDYKSWKPRRDQYNPYFTKSETQKRLIPTANQLVDGMIEKLKPESYGHPTEFELTDFINQYTQDTVSRVIFGADFPTKSRKELGLKEAKGDGTIRSLVLLALTGLQAAADTAIFLTLPLKFSKDLPGYKEAARVVREIGRKHIEKVIAAIKNKEEVSDSILSCVIKDSEDVDNLDLQVLVDDFMNFYAGGVDIIASEMIFTFILILQHPQVLDRVLEEVDEVLGDRDCVNAEDLDKLQYLDQVIHESLRMYPPALSVTKETPKGGTEVDGYYVPGGTTISVSQLAMHYMDKYFENPNQFDPDRFARDKKKPNPCAYFPFSLGFRDCIAIHFAMMESKIAIARLLQKFKFSIPPDYKIETEKRITHRLKGQLSCVCSPRK